jgi:DNA-binding NtrC family response regulator
MSIASSIAHRATVLHVEDDVALAASVAMLLRVSGFEAITASSSAAALAHIANGIRPDLLLVDYRLAEDATGTDVAEMIVRLLGYTVPTILLTADLPNAEIPWLPGAPIMLASKPMDPNALIDTIEHFTTLHRSAQSRRTAAQRRASDINLAMR